MSVLTQIDGGIGLAPRRMVLGGDADVHAACAAAAQALGWGPPEACPKALMAAVPIIDQGRPPALLVVDLDGEAAPLAALSALADACLAQTRVLAVGTGNDVGLYRALLAAGVSDYLVKPLQPDALVAALGRIDAAGDDAAARPSAAALGRVVAVIGARGGAGATTLATSLAWMIADRGENSDAGRRAVLVDFDLQFGSAAMALGVDPGPGLAAMLASPERLDAQLLAASLQPVNDRLGLMAAQMPVEGDAPVSPVAALALLGALRSTAQWVVADLPRTLDSMTRQVLRTADQVVVVAPPSLEGLRDTRRLMAWLRALRAGAVPLVVVNGVAHPAAAGGGEVTRKLFEDTIATRVAAWVPAMAGPAAAAAAHALPLAALAGGAAGRPAGGNPFALLAAQLTGEAPAPRRSRLPGWWPKR
jgi:pilus assembly protein CpaE